MHLLAHQYVFFVLVAVQHYDLGLIAWCEKELIECLEHRCNATADSDHRDGLLVEWICNFHIEHNVLREKRASEDGVQLQIEPRTLKRNMSPTAIFFTKPEIWPFS